MTPASARRHRRRRCTTPRSRRSTATSSSRRPTRSAAATAAAVATGGDAGGDFAGALGQQHDRARGLDQNAATLAVQAATGDLSDIQDYVIAATQAQLATQLTTTVRNKAVDAFNEIMRMPSVNPQLAAPLERGRTLFRGFTTGQGRPRPVWPSGFVLGAVRPHRWFAAPDLRPAVQQPLRRPTRARSSTSSSPRACSTSSPAAGDDPRAGEPGLRPARLAGGKNLPAGDSGGCSLLDQQGMTSTDFQQNVAYQRALEGELGQDPPGDPGRADGDRAPGDPDEGRLLRRLRQADRLGAARAAAGRDADEDAGPLRHAPRRGQRPGPRRLEVTVSDANGDLLSTREDGAAGAAAGGSETDEQTAQFEDRMGQSVQQMLDRVLGPGHAVVRVNAQLNFDTTETTSQTYVVPSPSVPPLSEATSERVLQRRGRRRRRSPRARPGRR